MSQAPSVTIDLTAIEKLLRDAGATDEEVLQVRNAILNIISKSKKYQERARVYREANKALGEIYRRIKYIEGWSGSEAWNRWHEIQRAGLRALTGLERQ